MVLFLIMDKNLIIGEIITVGIHQPAISFCYNPGNIWDNNKNFYHSKEESFTTLFISISELKVQYKLSALGSKNKAS